jgi:hypothetical protein
VYEVLPRDDPQGVLFLPACADPDDVLLVEARLVLIWHPVHVVDAVATPAFVEYWLVDADWLGARRLARRSVIVAPILPPGVGHKPH